MAIEIIDGFKLSSPRPIDDRIVASGSDARSAIVYKYEGLRVFDTSDGVPYVWLNNAWKKENSTGVSVPSTITPNYVTTSTYRAGQILKVLNANNFLTNSNMFEVEYLTPTGTVTGKTIAINHTNASSVTDTAKLDVSGTVKATSFSGNGANITNIVPSNFDTSSSKIVLSQIQPGTANYVLRTNSSGSALEWVSSSALSSGIGISSVSTTGGVSNNLHYLTLVPDSQPSQSSLFIYNQSTTRAIGIIPSSGQILVKSTSSPSTPPYSFIGSLSSGIYLSSTNQISISTSGNQRLEIDSSYIRIPSGSSKSILGLRFGGTGTTFNISNYGLYQAGTYISTVVNSDEVLRVFTSGSSQGSGSVRIYGNGGLLSLFGRSQGGSDTTAGGTYIQFYRTGGLDTTLTPTRSAYLGFGNSNNSTFNIYNEITNNYIQLSSLGQTLIYSNISNGYGTQIKNNGTSLAYGVLITARFTTSELSSSRTITRFDVEDGSNTYTAAYVNSQGVQLWGYTGVAQTPTVSGTITKPSLCFNNSTSTGLYSSDPGVIGFTSLGVKKMEINNQGVMIGRVNNIVSNHTSGYIVFVRNSSGGGFGYYGTQKGGVIAVTDVSGFGSSFSTTSGWITVRITFASGTFTGGPDDNVVVSNFGLQDTHPNILYYCQHISGKVIDSSTLEIRMQFQPLASGGYTIRLCFMVESVVNP